MSFLDTVILPLYVATVLAVLAVEFPSVLRFRAPIYASLMVAWTLAAALRPWGITPDDLNYTYYFNLTRPISEAGFRDQTGFSYAYFLCLSAFREVWNTTLSFTALSALFVFGKLYLVSRITDRSVFALLAYVSIFFMLHDVVQLRAGAAAFWLLLAIYSFSHKKYVLAGAAYAVGALFHPQVLILAAAFPIYFAFRHRYWLAVGAAGLSQVAVGFGLLPTQLLLQYAPLMNDRRLSNSIEQGGGGEGVRLTTLVILAGVALITPGIKKSDDRTLQIAFYAVIASFLVFWLMAGSSIVGNRLMQFLWVPLCLIAPMARASVVSFFGFLLICASYFYLSGWINDLLTTYVYW